MAMDKLISADSHIVEPPDLYTGRIEARFRDRAPRMERLETPTGLQRIRRLLKRALPKESQAA